MEDGNTSGGKSKPLRINPSPPMALKIASPLLKTRTNEAKIMPIATKQIIESKRIIKAANIFASPTSRSKKKLPNKRYKIIIKVVNRYDHKEDAIKNVDNRFGEIRMNSRVPVSCPSRILPAKEWILIVM
jgi:hypothetical protein